MSLRSFLLGLAVGLFVFALGCDSRGPDADPTPRELSAKEKQLVSSSQTFGLKLLRAAHAHEQESPNVVLSPLSVSMALGMALNGAEGDMRTAMEDALERGDLSPSEINDAYRDLIDLLLDLDPSVELALANSIWYKEGVSVQQDFLDVNREHFDATIDTLDFESPTAPQRINSWVDDATDGTIEKIVTSWELKDMMMYLTNAVYFNGPWRTQFDPDKTEDAPFHHPDGTTTQVPLMTVEEPVMPIMETDGFTAVDLAYADSLYTMTVILPNRDISLDSVVARLDHDTWERVTSELHPERLGTVKMPKFTLTYETSLVETLDSLGMGVAFDPVEANFDSINPDIESLHISDVKQKTHIRVHEEGTEASAATSVGVKPISASPSIRIDRPFVFVLREQHSGTLLFTGTVTDPTGR